MRCASVRIIRRKKPTLNGLLELVADYGTWIYGLLFVYCAVKSGSLPLFAGYAAQAGALELVPVIIASFAGGYLGDEVRFAVAKRYGISWSSRWPWLYRAMTAAKVLVARYGWAYVFLYRYPKGMRTVGAFPMGLGPLSWPPFTVLNAASAGLWTSILVGLGFVFGAQVEQAVEAGWGLASTVLLLVMILVIAFAWWRINRVKVV